MHELTELIKKDMLPALGVTEPAALAFAVAKAKKYSQGELKSLKIRLNSGMYKNAFTCGIPGSTEVGNYHAAALGVTGADPEKGLECLDNINAEQAEAAKTLVESKIITVELYGITSRIFIEATYVTETTTTIVTIQDSHTHITSIISNGKLIFEDALLTDAVSSPEEKLIHKYTLKQLHEYALKVSLEEIFFIKKAFSLNLELLQEGLSSPKTTIGPYLLKANGGKLISEDEQKTASLLCNGAIEARVLGLSKPAMSITGSGAHGIIATLPLYASYKVKGYSEEQLLRATVLSYLICTYIKEYSGKLSAFCGCAIAAGTGMACGLVLLRGGTTQQMVWTINNLASSITGMICDGGNQGCAMKGIIAVDAAFQSVRLAMEGVFISSLHGINGSTPEATMRNMGLIADPGMTKTENTILDILKEK